uniref:uncharacterized protein n=1 Tax=Myxine glutinosa TaxID=7769 RepID=UPI00358F6CD9
MASKICESPQPTRSSLKRSTTTAGSPKKAVSFDPSHDQIFYINDCPEKQSSSAKISVDIDDEPLGSIEEHIVEKEISWEIPEESEPSSSSQVLPAGSNVPEDFVERQTFHGWSRSPERHVCDSPTDACTVSELHLQGSLEKDTSGIMDYVVPNRFETGQNVVTPESLDVSSDSNETTDLQNVHKWTFQAETNEKDAINVLEGTDQAVCSVVTGLGSEEHSQSLHNVAEEQDRQHPPTSSSGGGSIPAPMRPASTQLSHTMPKAVERTSGNLLRTRYGPDPGFLSYSNLPRQEPFARSPHIGLPPSHFPIGEPRSLFYMPLPTIHRLPSAFGSPIATPTCPIMPRPAWYNPPRVSLHGPAGYSPFPGFGGHFPIRSTVASPLTGGAFYPRFM